MADRQSDVPVGPLPDPTLIPGFHDDRKPLVIFCVVFCLTVATAMVALRIWTRTMIIKKMGPDDWAAIITLVCAPGPITRNVLVLTRLCPDYNMGRGHHRCSLFVTSLPPPLTSRVLINFQQQPNMVSASTSGPSTLQPCSQPTGRYFNPPPPLSSITNPLKTFWVTLLFYHAGLLAAKMTFLLAYYRILGIQRMRTVYLIAIIIVGMWGFAQVLIALLICRPLNGMWDKTITAECMPTEPQIYVNAGGNIITDVAIFLLPMPAIKGLNLRKPQKILLLGVFSLGFFTVAISVVRIKFLAIKEDVTWDHVESSGWSVGELASALTCACLPTLRPLLAKFFPSLGSSYGSGASGPSGDSSNYPSTIGGGEGRRNPRGPAMFKVHGAGSPTNSQTGEAKGVEEEFHFSSDKTDYVELGLGHPGGGRGHSTDEGINGVPRQNPHGW